MHFVGVKSSTTFLTPAPAQPPVTENISNDANNNAIIALGRLSAFTGLCGTKHYRKRSSLHSIRRCGVTSYTEVAHSMKLALTRPLWPEP